MPLLVSLLILFTAYGLFSVYGQSFARSWFKNIRWSLPSSAFDRYFFLYANTHSMQETITFSSDEP